MGVHEAPGALQARSREVGPAAEKRTGPLVMDACGPLRSVEVRDGELEQQVAKRRRVQDGGVEEGDFDRQGSIAHAQLLGIGSEFVERSRAAWRPSPELIPAQVLEAHAAVRANLAERDVAPFQKADQEGAARRSSSRRPAAWSFRRPCAARPQRSRRPCPRESRGADAPTDGGSSTVSRAWSPATLSVRARSLRRSAARRSLDTRASSTSEDKGAGERACAGMALGMRSLRAETVVPAPDQTQ